MRKNNKVVEAKARVRTNRAAPTGTRHLRPTKVRVSRMHNDNPRKKKNNNNKDSEGENKKRRSKKKDTVNPPSASNKKVVRIMGHGQFTIDARVLKHLTKINADLVKMAASARIGDTEFKNKLSELNQVTIKYGKIMGPGEVARTDIILPSSELPVDEAKKLFIKDGVIPEN
jgi:hypothetical protein